MSTGSKIEWTGATWNPVVGCTRVSEGCDHCYAVRQSYRLERMGQEKYAGLTALNPRGDRHFNGVVRCDESALTIPLGWRKPRRIFVNSMSDLFHAGVPFEFIDRVFAVMALCPQHTYQILTKRPERMAEYLNAKVPKGSKVGRVSVVFAAAGEFAEKSPGTALEWHVRKVCSANGNPLRWPLPNVWLGTSVENQDAADERIPHLLRCPAAVRFLSCEPLLGDLHLDDEKRMYLRPLKALSKGCEPICTGIDWVIVGGESGPGARPCDVAWIRSIIGQCKAAGVPCFVKQLGARPIIPAHEPWTCLNRKGGDMAEWAEDIQIREWPNEKPDTGGKAE